MSHFRLKMLAKRSMLLMVFVAFATTAAALSATDSATADRPTEFNAERLIVEEDSGRLYATTASGDVISTHAQMPAYGITGPDPEPAPITAEEWWATHDLTAPLSDYERGWREGGSLDTDLSPNDFAEDPKSAFEGVSRWGARTLPNELVRHQTLNDAQIAISSNHDALMASPGYGGWGVDYSTGEIMLFVAPDADVSGLKQDMRTLMGPNPLDVRVIPVRTTLKHLFDAALNADELRKSGEGPPGWASTSLSIADNRLILNVEDVTGLPAADEEQEYFLLDLFGEEVQAIAGQLDVDVSIAPERDTVLHACTPTVCDQHLEGGHQITTDGSACSSNFAYKYGSSDGYLGSSGHCTNPSGHTGTHHVVEHGGVPSSWVTSNFYPSPDVTLFPWSDWAMGNTIYRSNISPHHAITSSMPEGAFGVGNQSCLAGRRSGLVLCGYFDYYLLDSNNINFFVILDSNRAIGGDSGAAWYLGSQAHGVHVGEHYGGDQFSQIDDVFDYCSCSLITRGRYSNLLNNWNFNAGAASSPDYWVKRPTGVIASRQGGGFAGTQELKLQCTTATGHQCSWYQDEYRPVSKSRRYGIQAYVDCHDSGGCDIDFVLWGMGINPAEALGVINLTVPYNSRTYVATTVDFVYDHNSLRFEMYNDDEIVGGYSTTIEFSNPLLVEAP